MAKPIPGIPSEWQNFLFCVALHLTLPLMPLVIERWFTGQIEEKSAVLTAAMYSMALGLSSRNIAIFGMGLLAGILFSAAFGFLCQTNHLEKADSWSYTVIIAIMIFHAIERYNRHVVDQAPFLEFLHPAVVPPRP